MGNRLLTSATFVAILLVSSAVSQQSTRDRLSLHEKATVTVACLAEKLNSIGAAPPQFEKGEYKVKALYGKFAEEDEANEIHLLIYGSKGKNAILYESYLATANGKTSVFIGNWATFKADATGLVPDELPGGLATHERILRLMKRVAKEEPFVVPRDQAEVSNRVCIWTP